MASCLAVQQKMSCVYVTGVHSAPSNKRVNQQFKVTASDELNPEVDLEDLAAARATEKVDGTCCLVQEYRGVPWLWARLDRKPNKAGDRKFQRHQSKLKAWKESQQAVDPPVMAWDHDKDFKEVPVTWIQASGIQVLDGVPQPDKLGHTPGWVPLEKKSRQYCWHLASVDLDLGVALVLGPGERTEKEEEEEEEGLVLRCRPLSELCGKTCELIGTNVNANPYGVGNKQSPIHLLVLHGSLPVSCPSPARGTAFHQWFAQPAETDTDTESETALPAAPTTTAAHNRVEGVVWHCPSGALFKLHRHHLNLPWPIGEPRLSQQPVRVDVDSAHFGLSLDGRSLLARFAAVSGRRAEKLCCLHHLLNEEET